MLREYSVGYHIFKVENYNRYLTSLRMICSCQACLTAAQRGMCMRRSCSRVGGGESRCNEARNVIFTVFVAHFIWCWSKSWLLRYYRNYALPLPLSGIRGGRHTFYSKCEMIEWTKQTHEHISFTTFNIEFSLTACLKQKPTKSKMSYQLYYPFQFYLHNSS